MAASTIAVTRRLVLHALVLTFFGVRTGSAAESNNWKSEKIPKGAELVLASRQIAIFMTSDGKQLKLPVNSLATSDQEYVKAFHQKMEALTYAPRKETNGPSIVWKEGVAAADPPYLPRTHYRAPIIEGKLHGIAQWSADNGKLVYLEQYSHGTVVDKKIQFYPSTQPYAIYLYKNGKADGRCLTFYPGGIVARAIDFKAGEPTGMFIAYYPNGQIGDIYHQIDGKSEGESRHYLPDGQLFETQTWVAGKMTKKKVLKELTSAESEQHESGGVRDLGDIWQGELESQESTRRDREQLTQGQQPGSGVRLLKVIGDGNRDVYGGPGGFLLGKVNPGSILRVLEVIQIKNLTWYGVRLESGFMISNGSADSPPKPLAVGWVPQMAVKEFKRENQ